MYILFTACICTSGFATPQYSFEGVWTLVLPSNSDSDKRYASQRISFCDGYSETWTTLSGQESLNLSLGYKVIGGSAKRWVLEFTREDLKNATIEVMRSADKLHVTGMDCRIYPDMCTTLAKEFVKELHPEITMDNLELLEDQLETTSYKNPPNTQTFTWLAHCEETLASYE